MNRRIILSSKFGAETRDLARHRLFTGNFQDILIPKFGNKSTQIAKQKIARFRNVAESLS
jgi:hypothetical protein